MIKDFLNPEGIKISSVVLKLRPFYWRGGFGLLVEFHREGSAPAACSAGTAGWSKISVQNRNFERSKITVPNRNFGRSKITILTRNFGWSKIMVPNHNFERSKFMVPNRNFGQSKIMVPNIYFSRSKITDHNRNCGPLSIWTVKFCKFGRSKLRHLDQGTFLNLYLVVGCPSLYLTGPV